MTNRFYKIYPDEAGGEHLTLEIIVDLALTDAHDPHLDICHFCREQIEIVRQSLSESDNPAEDEILWPEARKPYRLAAQAGLDDTAHGFRLRRTWYLPEQAAVLRVLEDESGSNLKGFLLKENISGGIEIRFSGLDAAFRPDEEGRFEIGPSSIDIEMMTVTLEEEA